MMINWVKELHKRGIKTTPLPLSAPVQTDQTRKIQQDVKKYLKILDKAYKASARSTLRFVTPITHHPDRRTAGHKNHQKTRG